MIDISKINGKSVLVTGHTGFKGTWLTRVLQILGASITGYSLEPTTNPSLFELAKIDKNINSVIGDIRDYSKIEKVFKNAHPEIVFHLAAQPIVKEGYINPRYTYETNMMGTVNILECIRNSNTVRSFLNITTDKVYENKEWLWGYREYDTLNGYDPYSNSKSCSDLITQSYRKSFFADKRVAISTVRAGNVIGGGDFAKHRIIPDCIRAAIAHEKIIVRCPNSIRPYQHVLDPIFAYLMIALEQYENPTLSDCYNVGPNESDCLTTREIVERFVKAWGEGIKWENKNSDDLYEASYLKLDCSKIRNTFKWKPQWDINTAVEKTVEMTKYWLFDDEVKVCMDSQINEFIKVGSKYIQ